MRCRESKIGSLFGEIRDNILFQIRTDKRTKKHNMKNINLIISIARMKVH